MEINTLVDDIYSLFDPNKTHEPNEDNLNEFAENLKATLRTALRERQNLSDPLRFSALGKPDRQIWYMAQGTPSEELRPQTYFKFLIGHVLEEVLLFLAKESGHEVSHLQEEVVVEGVKGHIDAIVDGYVIDVKTASPFGYKKFKEGTLTEDDPFGYVKQLSGYTNVLTPDQGGYFLAYEKVSGEICLSPLSVSVTQDNHPEPRIKHLKEVVSSQEPPPRCFSPVEDGKSGNMKLGTECSYCPYKKACWPNARLFVYSNGPRWLTTVARVPDVTEIRDW